MRTKSQKSPRGVGGEFRGVLECGEVPYTEYTVRNVISHSATNGTCGNMCINWSKLWQNTARSVEQCTYQVDKFLIPININRWHSKLIVFEYDLEPDKPFDGAMESFHLHINDRTQIQIHVAFGNFRIEWWKLILYRHILSITAF